MTDRARDGAREELEHVSSVLAEIGRRAVADPAFKEDLKRNQLEMLKAAGLSVLVLMRVAHEHCVSEDELNAYGLALLGLTHDDAARILVSTTCVGTCKSATVWVCGGCKHSVAQ